MKNRVIIETMAILQIRDLPDSVYQQIREQAKEEHRSIAQQAIIILKRGLGVDTDNLERRKKLLSQMAYPQIESLDSLPSPVSLVREDRER